jgi:hypothetical protein
MLSQLIRTSFRSSSSLRHAILLRKQISFPESRLEANQQSSGSSFETKVQVLVTDSCVSSATDGEREKKTAVQIWEKDARLSSLLTPEDMRSLLCESCSLCPAQSLRVHLLPLLSPPPEGGKRGRHSRDKPTVAQMTSNISEICLSSMATLLRGTDKGAEPLQELLSYCHGTLMRRESIFHEVSDESFHSELWLSSQEHFLQQLSEFLYRQLNLSSLLLPGIACCGQICKVPLPFPPFPHSAGDPAQVLSDICSESLRILLEKEELILCGTAHTTDRRQYLLYLLNLLPSKLL